MSNNLRREVALYYSRRRPAGVAHETSSDDVSPIHTQPGIVVELYLITRRMTARKAVRARKPANRAHQLDPLPPPTGAAVRAMNPGMPVTLYLHRSTP